MDRLFILLAWFSILLIALILTAVRREHIRVEYSVSWLGAAVVLLVLSQNHRLFERMAGAMGVSDAAVAMLTVSGGVFLVVLYRFSLIISRLKDSNIALVQRLAILEYRLDSNDEKTKADGD